MKALAAFLLAGVAVILVPAAVLLPVVYGSESNWVLVIPALVLGCAAGAASYKLHETAGDGLTMSKRWHRKHDQPRQPTPEWFKS